MLVQVDHLNNKKIILTTKKTKQICFQCKRPFFVFCCLNELKIRESLYRSIFLNNKKNGSITVQVLAEVQAC